jgi:hypothetical protein
MNALPFVSLVLAHPMFEPGKQLGEGVAERLVLRLVGEGPDVVDGLVKLVVVDWLRRFGCRRARQVRGAPRDRGASCRGRWGRGSRRPIR